jgi:hypothetical protein
MFQREELVRYYEQIDNMAKAYRKFDITGLVPILA